MSDTPRGFDRGSCLVFESDTPPPREQEWLEWLQGLSTQALRQEVEALFRGVLGDNTEHESVQRLIDGVVELIRKREQGIGSGLTCW